MICTVFESQSIKTSIMLPRTFENLKEPNSPNIKASTPAISTIKPLKKPLKKSVSKYYKY